MLPCWPERRWWFKHTVHLAKWSRRELRHSRGARRPGQIKKVDHGTAVAGVAGSGDLLEYTVLGNTVNLAARVETLTRVHDADVLVTEAVRARLDPGFQVAEKPATTVKGISKPLVTFAVDGYQGSSPPTPPL